MRRSRINTIKRKTRTGTCPRSSFRRANNNTEHETLLITFHRRTVFVRQDMRARRVLTSVPLPLRQLASFRPEKTATATRPHAPRVSIVRVPSSDSVDSMHSCTCLRVLRSIEPRFLGSRSFAPTPCPYWTGHTTAPKTVFFLNFQVSYTALQQNERWSGFGAGVRFPGSWRVFLSRLATNGVPGANRSYQWPNRPIDSSVTTLVETTKIHLWDPPTNMLKDCSFRLVCWGGMWVNVKQDKLCKKILVISNNDNVLSAF